MKPIECSAAVLTKHGTKNPYTKAIFFLFFFLISEYVSIVARPFAVLHPQL